VNFDFKGDKVIGG